MVGVRHARRRARRVPALVTLAEDPASAPRRAVEGLASHARSDAGCIAIVTHDAILQLALCHVLNLHIRNHRAIAQATATLNDLKWTGSGWRVDLLDSRWHLDGDAHE